VNSSCDSKSHMVGAEVGAEVGVSIYFSSLPKGRSWKKSQSVGNYGINVPILSDRGFWRVVVTTSESPSMMKFLRFIDAAREVAS
jgi:hypothetical protein